VTAAVEPGPARPLPGERPGSSRWFGARVTTGALVLQLSLGLVYVWGAMAPYVRAHDHWPPLLIGSVWSAGPLGYSIGMVVAGRLADRLPPRRICWASLVLMASGLAVAFIFPSELTFPLFYSGLGLGLGGGVGMAGSVAAGVHAHPQRVGLVGGAVTGAYALAALIQVPVASRLAPEIGWTDTLRVVGSALVVLAALALLLMPPLPVPRHARAKGTIESPLTMFRRPLVWTAFLMELATGVVGSAAFVNLVTYARTLGIALVLATTALTAMAVGNAAGRLTGGTLADRFSVDRVMLAVLLCNLTAAGLLWHLSAETILAAGLAAGLAFGGGAGILSRLGARAAPEAPNSAFGLIFVGYSAGAFAGPLVAAAIGLSSIGWLLMGLFPLAGLVVLGCRSRVTA
jgi:predicted MFS family arabinose efflux permease